MRIFIACAVLCLLWPLAGCKPAPAPGGSGTEPLTSTTPSPPAQRGEVDDAPREKESPSLRLMTLDGANYDLAAQRGKWVVVNFWATWCPPCLKEMPELSALVAMREHIEVIGLAYEDIEPEDLKVFLCKHPVVYPVAIIDTSDPPKDFATPRGLPMTYLIAPDGRVAKRFLGPVTAQEIETAIAAAGGPALPG